MVRTISVGKGDLDMTFARNCSGDLPAAELPGKGALPDPTEDAVAGSSLGGCDMRW